MRNKQLYYFAVGGVALAVFLHVPTCVAAPVFPKQDLICKFDANREKQRLASAKVFSQPVVQQMLVNDSVVWTSSRPGIRPVLKPGDKVTLTGSGFGAGTDVDFSKILIGNSRVLETDLVMYEQKLDLLAGANYETGRVVDNWPKDIRGWADNEVVFRVPEHVSKGPIKLQVQKRVGHLDSLTKPGQPNSVIDAQRNRLSGITDGNCDVVSVLSDETKAIAPIDVQVENAAFGSMAKLGRSIFWSYDYGLGVAHSYKNLDWEKILSGQAIDPYTRQKADPFSSFGAYKTVKGQVPDEAINDVFFDPYPQESPIPGFLLFNKQLAKGTTSNTGWVGYRYAESSHPLLGRGKWIGFNCASCHGYQISYNKDASKITKVFPGLPNPRWTQRWTVLGDKKGDTTATFSYIVGNEPGPNWMPGNKKVDKTALLYLIPPGATESRMARTAKEGGIYDNDYIFSPVAIPNITNHLPIRRSLGHTESFVGFEGSYVHAQEPEGTMGAMGQKALKALTAYMSTLDESDDDLRNVGLFRWLRSNNKIVLAGGSSVTEGDFVKNGWKSYPGVSSAVSLGKASFGQNCASCHGDKVGANTNEKMIRLDEVGRFFPPNDFQYKQQSIRTTFLRNLYWVSSRGLLSDGHVRNLEDLVSPDRCDSRSALYKQYYTLHAPMRPKPGTADQPTPAPDLNRKGDVFRVYKAKKKDIFDTTSDARNLFVERHKYFVNLPGDSDHYYWDYQKMRREFGPEIGAPGPIGLPASPHPWCAKDKSEVENLVMYLLTL